MSDGTPQHSPLGGSGVSTIIACPGSVRMSWGIEDEENEFAAEGTAAHAVAEHCLKTGLRPWRQIGVPHFQGAKVSKEMADAVYAYIEAVELWHPNRSEKNTWIERKFKCPSIHKYFYGTSDLVHLDADTELVLHVWDYKHGAGIVVEAEHNDQAQYYACGVLEELDLWTFVDKVVIHIFQPRGWHWQGPHRTWETTPAALEDWMIDTLIPAMDKAMVSDEVNAGPQCRFCPARSHQCPATTAAIVQLEKLMREFEGNAAKPMTPEQAGEIRRLGKILKIVDKANDKTIFNMLSRGIKVAGVKLVKARVNRVWKDGAQAKLIAKFGKKRAFTLSVLHSPAQIEALPGGKEMAARYAHKPPAGLTIGNDKDTRAAVSRDTTASLFTDQTKRK